MLAAVVRISQYLGMHRLDLDRPELTASKGTTLAARFLVDREVKKHVWWFLVRQDWLRIPFQDTFLIHPAQFNTPMPLNFFNDLGRML
ncbi:hypothetical protein K431DRAFT_287902 [Polychaeton citri CBS 116435]|uniref:Transcription factor domain-containing protein n=1 Tax=Polychaeton citri CBS 116435 TaxID=1314669 RepID=A0A9P4Q4G4_9PEZI|nr:hypothetical protein K431DRAFT_287902 [Polychaeton citri CBS 116435]